ncbi:hypothetical protein GY45DRAFT_1054670 [Cubamyces sp. BRFM 1775]|nr:hypothetical protein GY45DRAFT_1054670 [Cubamyces sp. BRFM 1775]
MPRLLLPILVGILTSAVQHVVEGFAAATSPSPSLGPSSPSSLTTESFPPWRIPSQCTDMRYYWLSNNRDQFPCYVASAVAQDCANSIQDSSGPLGSLSCPCNTVLYSLVYACGLCTDTQDWLITFGEWANDIDCGGTAYREYPRNLIPFGVIIPFWAYWDLTLDHYFDVERAREAASPPVTTSARSSSPLTTIPTQSSKCSSSACATVSLSQ